MNNLKNDQIIGLNFLFPSSLIIQSTVMIKKTVFEQVGKFNEDKSIFGVEDFDLWLRVFPNFKGVYLNECLIYYRIHASASGSVLVQANRALYYYENYLKNISMPEKYKKTNFAYIHYLYFLYYLENEGEDYKQHIRTTIRNKINFLYITMYLAVIYAQKNITKSTFTFSPKPYLLTTLKK